MSHSHRRAPLILVLASAVLVGALLTACGGDSGGTSVKSAGSYRERFAKGDGSAINELAAKGEAAVPTLVTLLGDNEEIVVQCAAMTLKKIDHVGPSAVGALFVALEKFPTNPNIVDAIKKHRKSAAGEIVRVIKTGSPEAKARAVKLINGIGWRGAAAADPLIAILQGSAPDSLKIEAMGALASLGMAAEAKSRPALEEIEAKGGELATYATRNLKRLDSAQSNLASRISELLDSDSVVPQDTKIRAINTLITVGPPGHHLSIPALEKAAAEQGGKVGARAAEALKELKAQR